MSSYTAPVGSCCGRQLTTDYGMKNIAYSYENYPDFADAQPPRIKPYSGWASYKNVKSGNYNRQLCGTCLQPDGFVQSPGVYDVNISYEQPKRLSEEYMRQKDREYQIYQQHRMINHPGNVFGETKFYDPEYVNYHNRQCGQIYPKQYWKGWWPYEFYE